MASLGEVRSGISYSGLTKFQEVWDISVIDINLKDQAQEILSILRKQDK